MTLHPTVIQQNGIVNVTLTAQFKGDSTDPTDKQRIQAYGDPQVNLGGLFTDPSNTAFTFNFPATELYVGLTTQMQGYTARFMTALPTQPATNSYCQPVPCQGPLECITANPVEAASVWTAAIQARCASAMTALRALTPAQLTTLADATI